MRAEPFMLSLPRIIEANVPLAPYTYFRIGGEAMYLGHIASEQDVVDAVDFAHTNHLRMTVLSGGSNVLVSDAGFDGIVLHMEMREAAVEGNTIRAGAGVPMAKLVATATAHGLEGISWAIGIPGMVGGSVRGNAGCFGGEVKDTLVSVRVYDMNAQAWQTLTNTACVFEYRDSMFKRHPELIITEATFALREGNTKDLAERVRAHIQLRVMKQDIGEKCAGCMFKNPKGAYAGELIELAGLKGFAIGGAHISKKHANFIVNDGNASAEDVRAIVAHVKEKVQQSFYIVLEEEIQYIS